ncbi:hypothetical protein [Streptomyces sp. NPDC058664]|uniref:hypothetical protein n=1 Tax=Streptomyces sp. NPDC058664 TaxID=3346585 RepID=UPI00365C896B
MRSTLILVAGLAALAALVSAPELVIDSLFTAAFVVVLWKMLTHRRGPLRRGGRR